MAFFLQRLKPLAFSWKTPLGIILGIILGIFMGLPYYIFLFVLLGWIFIPSTLVQLLFGNDVITHSISSAGYPAWVSWVEWGIVIFYILFLCCYGWCAYQATQRTGSVSAGIGSALWLAFVMILSAIIPSALTMMWCQKDTLSTLPFYLGGTLVICSLFSIPLAIMALLTGYAGVLLGKRFYTKALAETA
jgi:hypothetical protein